MTGRTSGVPKPIAKTAKPVGRESHAPSLAYEDALIESLKDRNAAADYLEAAIEDGDQAVLMLAPCPEPTRD